MDVECAVDYDSLKEELDQWKDKAQSYRVVAESFEKRVLDLKLELRQKDEEIERLKQQLESVVAQERKVPSNDASSKQEGKSSGGRDVQQDQRARHDYEKFRKLFIGGLNNSTTEQHLMNHFSQYGAIESCRVMRDSTTNNSRGFAFIVFVDATSIDEVQKNRPHHVDNRTVETKRAIPANEADNNKNGPPTNTFAGSRMKVFIGGLKSTTEAATLHNYFSRFGKVETVNILEDQQTHKRRGFAYVTFSDSDTVDKVVLQRYHMIDGNKTEAKRAKSVEQMNQIKSSCAMGGSQPDTIQWGTGPVGPPPGPPMAPWAGPGEAWAGHRPAGPSINVLQLANLLGNIAQAQQYGPWDHSGPDGAWPPDPASVARGPNKMNKPRGGQRAPGPYGGGYGLPGSRD